MSDVPFDLARILPLLIPIALLQLGLQIYALVDLSRRAKDQVRLGNKWVWVAIIVLTNMLGPILYLAAGRKDE